MNKKMEKVGILGPRGTHSEEAALRLNEILEKERELIIFAEISEILTAVENGEIDSGFVPVENSLEGSINITLDTLARSNSLKIARELVWTVHNHLMAKNGVKKIKKIFSHAQPISQCRNFLKKNYPDAEIVITTSTARAAENVAESDENDGYAAICTKRAGELNKLATLATEIQDNASNRTRFFEVKKNYFSMKGDKILIICQIEGSEAGSLCEVLKEFSFRHVNLTRIESRPARTELGEYIFFFDLENNVDRRTLNDAIGGVLKKSIWLKDLGTFPVIIA